MPWICKEEANLKSPVRFKDSYYLVYPEWRVYSEKTKRFLKSFKNDKGYNYYDFRINKTHERKSEHFLVASCFVPNPNNYPQVCHLNDIRDDNRSENLMWGTQSMNIRQAVERGRLANRASPKGELNRNCKTSEKTIFKIRELSRNGMPNKEIGQLLGLGTNYVRLVSSRKIWKHI